MSHYPAMLPDHHQGHTMTTNTEALLRGASREDDAHDEAKADRYCDMGVGCGEYGACYAAANGEPERCSRATHPAPTQPATAASVSDAVSTVRERYRATKWGKAAECICDAVDEAILALRPAQAGDQWREAVEEQFAVNHISMPEDPREAIQKLIATEVRDALDPTISSAAAELVQAGVPDGVFDLICNAIDKADTITMEEADYMLDSDDCIAVVRVMQGLMSIRRAMLALRPAQAGVPDDIVKDAQRYRTAKARGYQFGRHLHQGCPDVDWLSEDAIDAAMLAASQAQKGGA